MAKRTTENREGEDWLELATSKRQERFYSFKGGKWGSVWPGRRRGTQEPRGSLVMGIACTLAGLALIGISIFKSSNFGIFLLITGLGVFFLWVGSEHFRYASKAE